MMKGYRKIVSTINNTFITIILFIVYFPVLGICYALYQVTRIFEKRKENSTYWIESDKKNFNKKYFESSY